MTSDDNDRPRTSSGRPDPSFIKRLEDDSLWQEQPRPVRRTDRYAERDRARGTRSERSGEPRYQRTSASKRLPPRSRRLAVIVLVVVVIVLLIAGLELTDETVGSQTTPFSLLPLEAGGITATSSGGLSTPSTEASTSSTTSDETTTTTGP